MTSGDIARCCSNAGIVASAQQVDALLQYVQLLQRWNATYNLTSVRDVDNILTQHIADCLAVVQPLERHADGRLSLRLLDVGSGGGLPAVVIAAMLPAWHIASVDAVGKKAAFVRQVAAALPLPRLQAHHARVETLSAPPFDVITSRAFASLSDFSALSAHLLAPAGVWLAMKGKRPNDEIEALPPTVDMFHVEQLQITQLNAKRCLIWMRPRLE